MKHIFPYIVMTFFGVLIMLFTSSWVGLLGFGLVAFGTFEAVFHLTVDEHVRL